MYPRIDPQAKPGRQRTDYVKQLNSNTYFSYGVGDEHCFGHKAGKAVRGPGHKTYAEWAGMLHGGCMAYLIDNCCSTPLVVLGDEHLISFTRVHWYTPTHHQYINILRRTGHVFQMRGRRQRFGQNRRVRVFEQNAARNTETVALTARHAVLTPYNSIQANNMCITEIPKPPPQVQNASQTRGHQSSSFIS
ncbi:putative thioesterase superfamily protein [Lyophyllum shimeji]|uniref:Thioesterase superfamily protein n=1 Tax=Lyophyllum shimeji TaxID=47721 RepID=A0A9P3UP74_LYOSH|nr:putative thioesterase superfamily protein [Lyophyllum shimeji]